MSLTKECVSPYKATLEHQAPDTSNVILRLQSSANSISSQDRRYPGHECLENSIKKAIPIQVAPSYDAFVYFQSRLAARVSQASLCHHPQHLRYRWRNHHSPVTVSQTPLQDKATSVQNTIPIGPTLEMIKPVNPQDPSSLPTIAPVDGVGPMLHYG
ncbi:hypothetical protein DL98DRAFT_570405 [Cadophora sp. DSE1049]|nr:hypothetical protein DL98DRAFT_570405 [Cadophora sp. DSE1049]